MKKGSKSQEEEGAAAAPEVRKGSGQAGVRAQLCPLNRQINRQQLERQLMSKCSSGQACGSGGAARCHEGELLHVTQ